MTFFHRLLALAAVCVVSSAACAEDITLLSGGAVEPGLKPAIAAFEASTGHTVRVTFNAAPQIGARIGAGEVWDVVIAPVGVLDNLRGAGHIGAERVGVGRVGIGVAVRSGAPVPEIGDVDSLKRSILAADGVVFNRASTGIAFESSLRRLDLADAVQPKATRPPDGAGVMEHLLQGSGREIGFAAITEILLFRDRGIRYVGPLPPAVQTFTAYAAAIPSKSAHPEPGRLLLDHLRNTSTQAMFSAAGIDPAP